MTLTEFLLARIAEDEYAASKAGSFTPWSETFQNDNYGHLTIQPARVLAECEAKRGLLTFVLEHGAAIDGEFGCCHDAEALLAGGRVPEFDGDEFEPVPDDCLGVKAARPGLRMLALPYADHEDFDESWRP